MTTAAARLERTTLRTSRLFDFCSRKELIAQTGHQPDAWPLVEVRIPDNLRTEVEDRLSEDTAATWDSIVRDIAEQKFEDDVTGDDE